MTAMAIDVWSDVICPFCYLGSRQLSLALAGFEHRDEVAVTLHAFELDPHAPTDLDQSLDDLVAAKYGIEVTRARELHRRLEDQAASLEMTWALEKARPGNTLDAHRLIALATDQGRGEEMSQRLFRAYFSEGVPVSDRARLSALAAEIGIEGVEALWSSEAYTSQVREDESIAQDLGITGVPAFLVDRKFMVLGAQGAAQIADVLRRAWARRTDSPAVP